MKKVVMAVLAAAMMAGLGTSGAFAQEKKVDFSLNLGVQTNIWSETSFDNAWFTLDMRAGFALGRSFEISPELMYAVDDSFDFSIGWLYPGVLFNYKSGGFFAGAGVVLPIVFGEGDSDTGNLAPKVNVGYDFSRFKVTAYFLAFTESGIDFLDMNQAGITLGYRF